MMISVVPIIFIVFILPILLVIGAFVGIVRALHRRGESQRLSDEDNQKLYHLMQSLDKMNGRIENLETILGKQEAPPGEAFK